MFKVGQKVVYVGAPNGISEGCIEPIKDSIQSVSGIIDFGAVIGYSLIGYEFAYNGNRQFFQAECLRPLDYAFVEEVITQVQPEKQPA